MRRFKFSELTDEIVNDLVLVKRESGRDWQPPAAELTDIERLQLDIIKNRLQHEKVSRLNEATVWGKAVYPVLLLIENEIIKSWAEVLMSAAFDLFVLEGVADGLISEDAGGNPKKPYLVVVEGKKGIDAKDPQPQLYGVMLAAARLNWNQDKREPQTIYGCYTIADSWTFLRGEISKLESNKVVFAVEASREFVVRYDAEKILGILKAIVAKNEQQ